MNTIFITKYAFKRVVLFAVFCALIKFRKRMYAVVTFIEDQQFRVLTVPMSWIKKGMLMWPKLLSKKKIDVMRQECMKYHGSVKLIPVTINRKFRKFESAEEAAAALLERETPNKRNTKKRLNGPNRKSTEDYDSNSEDVSTSSEPVAIPSSSFREPPPTNNHNHHSHNGSNNACGAISSCYGMSCCTYVIFKQEMERYREEQTKIIQAAVEAAVTKCFEQNFTRLASLLKKNNDEASAKDHTSEVKAPSGKLRLITNEEELVKLNDKLDDDETCQYYLNYFSKIVPPDSYTGKGDNACYIIVDCLFSRGFWNRFTWTGINRGGLKSSRGFRQFGNVTKLLLDIVRIGDPLYTFQKLETFCKARLFRYSKARASNKQLRKSACRPGRNKAASCEELIHEHSKIKVLNERMEDDGSEGEEYEFVTPHEEGEDTFRSEYVAVKQNHESSSNEGNESDEENEC